MRFVDPDGMEATLYITGGAADKATEQLQSSGTNLKLQRDSETGKVEIVGGEAITEEDKKIQALIKDESVEVNVVAEESNKVSEGLPNEGAYFTGGAYLGTFLNIEKSTVKTIQQVNPSALEIMDNHADKPGAGIMHEVTESYAAGILSKKKGQASINGDKISRKAHRKATDQPVSANSFHRINVNGFVHVYLGTVLVNRYPSP